MEEAQALADAANADAITDPWAAMSEIAGEAAEIERALRSKVKSDDYAAPALVTAWTRSLERVGKILTELARMDPEAKRITITQRQTLIFGEALKDATSELFDLLREALPPADHHLLAPIEKDTYPALARRILREHGQRDGVTDEDRAEGLAQP